MNILLSKRITIFCVNVLFVNLVKGALLDHISPYMIAYIELRNEFNNFSIDRRIKGNINQKFFFINALII